MTTSTLFELPPPAALPALCGYCHKPVTGVERIGGMSSIGTVPVANPKFASPPPMPEGVTAGECVDCNGEIVREQLGGWLERQRTLLNGDQVDAWQRHIRSDATH